MRKLGAMLAAVTAFLLIPTISAAQGTGPGNHLIITHVGVGFDDESLVITGEQLDFGPGPFQVFLGPDDITDLCDETIVGMEITCDLGANSGIPADGDYLVVVSNGRGQSQSDEYDLTIQRVFIPAVGLVYTDRETKGAANLGEAVANNKFVDADCAAGDILLSGGVQIAGSDGQPGAGGVVTPFSTQERADHINILENRPLGGATKWRGRAHEFPGANPIGQKGWQITTWVVCLDITP